MGGSGAQLRVERCVCVSRIGKNGQKTSRQGSLNLNGSKFDNGDNIEELGSREKRSVPVSGVQRRQLMQA